MLVQYCTVLFTGWSSAKTRNYARKYRHVPGDQLSWLRIFVVFLSPSRHMPG
jgi:hypothetical protein